MKNETAVLPKRSGLAILWDTIVAPNTAFDTLRVQPRWLVALLACIIVGTIGSYLEIPATMHATAVMFPKLIAQNPSLAGLSAEKQQEALNNIQSFDHFAPVVAAIVTPILLLFSSVVVFVAALVAKAKASFGVCFAIMCNAGFVYYGLFTLIVGVLAVLRGPEGYSSSVDLFSAVPGLAWLVPGGAPKLVAFLSLVNPFTIWSFALNVIGMHRAAGMGYVAASIVAALFLIASAASLAAGAQ